MQPEEPEQTGVGGRRIAGKLIKRFRHKQLRSERTSGSERILPVAHRLLYTLAVNERAPGNLRVSKPERRSFRPPEKGPPSHLTTHLDRSPQEADATQNPSASFLLRGVKSSTLEPVGEASADERHAPIVAHKKLNHVLPTLSGLVRMFER